jgi:hypothetical protein
MKQKLPMLAAMVLRMLERASAAGIELRLV